MKKNIRFEIKDNSDDEVIEVGLVKNSLTNNVVLVCESGVHGRNIAGITPDGRLRLFTGADIKGIQTDKDGRIVVEN